MTYNPYTDHRRSIRLPNYDYSKKGLYYVTLCSIDRECLFGEVSDDRIILNLVGKIIDHFWSELGNRYLNISTDEYIIMPNHMHGIIIINDHNEDCRGVVTTPLPKLGKIITWYKYNSTKYVNRLRRSPGAKLWQRNYYDRIIRDENENNRIVQYIRNNPLKWESDKNNPLNF
jgi:REP element-mobilizing transposase RayT